MTRHFSVHFFFYLRLEELQVRVSHLYFHNGNTKYLLGSFCYTPAGRLLFYPGIKNRAPLYFNHGGRVENLEDRNKGQLIHHITLEKNMKSWHITCGDNNRQVKLKSLQNHFIAPEKDNVFFWFSMSIKNPECLEPIPKVASISFNTPKSDLERRMNDIKLSRHGDGMNIVKIDEINDFSNKHIFFSFIVNKNQLINKEVINSHFLSSALVFGEQKVPYIAYPHVFKINGFQHNIAITATLIDKKIDGDSFIAHYPAFNT